MKKEVEIDRDQRFEELSLDSLGHWTRELYDAAAKRAPVSVISSLNKVLVSSYDVCLAFDIPHFIVARRFLEEMPEEKRRTRIDIYKRILSPDEYRELANHFGIRR